MIKLLRSFSLMNFITIFSIFYFAGTVIYCVNKNYNKTNNENSLPAELQAQALKLDAPTHIVDMKNKTCAWVRCDSIFNVDNTLWVKSNHQCYQDIKLVDNDWAHVFFYRKDNFYHALILNSSYKKYKYFYNKHLLNRTSQKGVAAYPVKVDFTDHTPEMLQQMIDQGLSEPINIKE